MLNLERNECTGCMACANVCKIGAINIVEDKYGQLYPQINNEICINCLNCEKVCPRINEIEKSRIKQAMVYKCYNENIKNSSSGGFAYSFAEFVIEEYKGIVYSSVFNKDNGVEYSRINKKEKLSIISGSKYVYSFNNMYKYIKNDLDSGEVVLLIGLPCMISGVYKFLNKKYKNFYTIELICHGVPSLKTFNNYLLEKRINLDDIKNISFRNKNKYLLTITNKDKNKIVVGNEYNLAFLHSFTIRESCYNCRYIGEQRVADISIGDAWGYKDNQDGYNLVLLNRSNVEDIIYKFLSNKNCFFEKIELENIGKINAQVFNKPHIRQEEIDRFKRRYNGNNLVDSYNYAVKWRLIKESIKKNIIKKLIKR